MVHVCLRGTLISYVVSGTGKLMFAGFYSEVNTHTHIYMFISYASILEKTFIYAIFVVLGFS